ncbi:6615_t:CDS:10 [Ambispora gerdemannii]|uniref:6615_t:CDS:1 n=1 Tax=Ambispora gerdemannii TaxID=144530 RepID=A0A9N8ZVP6_9GLOM|nr:6615_t:CDS:10 [Ambispora gerdemannii]
METEFQQLREHFQLLRKEFSSSSQEEVLNSIKEPLLLLEEGKNSREGWRGPPISPKLQQYFIDKLYFKHLEFLLQQVPTHWSEKSQGLETQKRKLITEYFVPSGTKDLQKKLRAWLALQVLVSHLSIRAISKQEKNNDYIPRLNITLIFLLLLLKDYSIKDFYEAIFSNLKSNYRIEEKQEEWREFAALCCSIPQRWANLRVLEQDSKNKVKNLDEETMKDVNYFTRLGSEIELAIWYKSNAEEEMEILSFALGEVITKICKIGHSSEYAGSFQTSNSHYTRFQHNIYHLCFKEILMQSIYFTFYNRLYNHISPSYWQIWSRMLQNLPPDTLESFISAVMTHSELSLLKSIPSMPIDDNSRYRIQKVAWLLKMLMGENINDSIKYMIKSKYFIGGKIFSVGVLRVLCCFWSWGKPTEKGYSAELDVKDDLAQLLLSLISIWSDPTFIKHASNGAQIYLTSAIIIIFGYFQKETLIKAAIPGEVVPGVGRWLKSPFFQARKIGMITAEIISQLTDEPDKSLKFEMEEDDTSIYLRNLVNCKDGTVKFMAHDVNEEISHVDETIRKNEENESKIESNKLGDETIDQMHSINKDHIAKEIADSDDEEGEFEPYPMEEESDKDENSSRKKIKPPVYIKELISYLKTADDPEKIDIALQVAPKLIRQKIGYGTELDEHAVELTSKVVYLQNTYELERFDENQNAALVALVYGSPKLAVSVLIEQFFRKSISLSQRFLILASIAKGAKELAGIKDEQEISAENKAVITLDSVTMNNMKISPINDSKVTKEKRFSKKMIVEMTRDNSIKINRFNEFAADTFFIPLIAGWWNWTRDGDHGNIMYQTMLVQRFITTLGVIVQCSINTFAQKQIVHEFWDLILSMRFLDDPGIIFSLLYGINVIVNAIHGRELVELFSKELVETEEWVSGVMNNRITDNKIMDLAAQTLYRVKNIVAEYQRMLLGNLLPIV